MIKKSNVRLTITISKQQEAWIRQQALKYEMSVSKFIVTTLATRSRERDIQKAIKIAKVNLYD